MTTIHHAFMSSRCFDFDGFGNSRAEALDVLQRAITLHTQQFDLYDDWYTTDDFACIEIVIGMPYRDNEAMLDQKGK